MLRQRKKPIPRVERLDWDLLRVFLAVARDGQMARAGARLGLDISTISRRLDRLEAELGVVLFEGCGSHREQI
ncbi:MAG: LysR family transcriptional regulator [Deltaproteobacteria bacterium]|nr:LysR family transcriptional regulator [Deltaproteobacteria bacterium]